jgi:hypothetical protein
MIAPNMRFLLRLCCATALLAACTDNNPAPADAAAPRDATPDAALDAAPDAEPPPPRMCRAGAGWDRAAMMPAFRVDAAGWGLDALTGKRLATADLDNDGYADLVVWNDVVNARSNLDATPPVVNTRVLMNRPREGGAGRRFVDNTRASNLLAIRGGGYGRMVQSVAFADVDNDGDLDAYTGTQPTQNPTASQMADPGDRGTIMLNDGSGVFSLGPESDATPTPESFPQTIGAVFADQNLDGRVDLFVGYHSDTFGLPIGQQSQLFRGDGQGSFADVTDDVGLTLNTTSASLLAVTNNRPLYGLSACDVNNDRRPDMIGAAYGRQFNLLMTSNADGYRDDSVDSNVGGDSDRDFSSNQSYRCYCQVNAGRCPATVPAPAAGICAAFGGTTGRGWRVGVDDQPWRNNGNSFSIACGDVDNDGDVDLYTGEIAHGDVGATSDRAQLLENVTAQGMPARFNRIDRTTNGLTIPLARSADEGVLSNAIFDFDNDGRQDIWAGGSDYPGNRGWLFQQQQDGRFAEVSTRAGIVHACPVGLALADFDNDGDLDVVLATSLARSCSADWMGRAVVRLYENVSGEQNWTSVRLVGRGDGGANRAGVGARVRVTAGGVTQTRDVQGNWGLAGLSAELVAHVGLGAQCAIERLEVQWPDAAGTTEVFTDIPANYRLEVRQGEGRVRYLR